MVAILCKIFGLAQLDLIEDAIQDTFVQASLKWRNGQPENPEAWLSRAARNRVIDLLRQVNARQNRHDQLVHGAATLQINEFFLDHEVEDSQLRMIFVACHPAFSQHEQIAFALKAISGFSQKEIAAALLLKEETIKKRLTRARKKIIDQGISLDFPTPDKVSDRMAGVLQIIYLIFNEGFHSTKSERLIDKELCGEALRLAKLLLIKEKFRSGSLYALFALFCFHSSRLESKIIHGEIIDLRHQDRSKWHFPLIALGNDALLKALDYRDRSVYHLEALIASEHIRAIRFEDTNWNRILRYYQEMFDHSPSAHVQLSKAITYLHLDDLENAKKTLDNIDPARLNQRNYLLFGTYAEYYVKTGNIAEALEELHKALGACQSKIEHRYLKKKEAEYMLLL